MTKCCSQLFLLLITAVCCTSVYSQEPAAFNRESLFKQFDSNRNQQLKPDEVTAIRKTFGGIDIPLLPAVSLDYEHHKSPRHIKQTELDELDNTLVDNPITNAGATLGNAVNDFHRRIFLVFATGFSRWCLSHGQSGEPASAGLSVAELVNWLKPQVKSG